MGESGWVEECLGVGVFGSRSVWEEEWLGGEVVGSRSGWVEWLGGVVGVDNECLTNYVGVSECTISKSIYHHCTTPYYSVSPPLFPHPFTFKEEGFFSGLLGSLMSGFLCFVSAEKAVEEEEELFFL